MTRSISPLAVQSCALFALVMLAACGEVSCPAGAVAEGDRCVPAPSCEEGEARVDGSCVTPDGAVSDPDSAVDEEGAPDADSDGGGDGDGDGDGDDEGACELDCGAHGECEVVEDEARCACEGTFAGDQCELCASGFALDGDDCVPACDAPTAPDCGEQGTCSADSGAAACECERSFGGALCDECAEGFVPEGEQCVPCGECGEHSYCDDDAEVPACVCVAGYAMNGETCVWRGDGTTGGFKDGELDDPEAWATKHVSIEDGFATFENATIDGECELGVLEQTITMPDMQDAEPLRGLSVGLRRDAVAHGAIGPRSRGNRRRVPGRGRHPRYIGELVRLGAWRGRQGLCW